MRRPFGAPSGAPASGNVHDPNTSVGHVGGGAAGEALAFNLNPSEGGGTGAVRFFRGPVPASDSGNTRKVGSEPNWAEPAS